VGAGGLSVRSSVLPASRHVHAREVNAAVTATSRAPGGVAKLFIGVVESPLAA
jgi:hypothetical protein